MWAGIADGSGGRGERSQAVQRELVALDTTPDDDGHRLVAQVRVVPKRLARMDVRDVHLEVGRHLRGRISDGVGLLDATTAGMQDRAIGEVASKPTRAGVTADLTEPLTGFENHLGATILGPSAQPLGTLTRGNGNADQAATADLADGSTQRTYEGAVQGSVIATYMHGPALARNPQLADLLLAQAMGVTLADLEPLEIPAVDRLRVERFNASEPPRSQR